MKKVINSLIIAFIAIGSINSFAASVGATGGGSCTATSTLGNNCSVTCIAPDIPKCESGIFTTDCTCVANPNAPSIRNIPTLSSQEITDCNDLMVYCTSYGTSNMTTLAGKISSVLSGVASGNPATYTSAEIDYSNFFISTLTSTEKSAINTWVQGRGYPGF